MTTETDCPSHIEARLDAAKIVDLLARWHEGNAKYEETLLFCSADYAKALRTLLATPTQEGVGREAPMTRAEIEQWIDACNHEPAKETLRHYLSLTAPTVGREEVARLGKAIERTIRAAWMLCEFTDEGAQEQSEQAEQWAALRDGLDGLDTLIEEADECGDAPHAVTMLLRPSPTERADPGAGEDSLCRNIQALLDLDAAGALVPHGIGGLARELLTKARERILATTPSPASTSSGEAAPGASEGWLHVIAEAIWLDDPSARQCGYTFAQMREADPGGNALDNAYRKANRVLAALTSSSAKPQEAFRIAEAEWQVSHYAQSYRRLREGLEWYASRANYTKSGIPFEITSASTIRPDRGQRARAALKDNGHG